MFATIGSRAPDFEIVIVIENVENRSMKIDCRGRERGYREINHNVCLKILFENRISRKNFILVERPNKKSLQTREIRKREGISKLFPIVSIEFFVDHAVTQRKRTISGYRNDKEDEGRNSVFLSFFFPKIRGVNTRQCDNRSRSTATCQQQQQLYNSS